MAGGIPRPRGGLKRFFSETTPYDLILLILVAAAGAFNGWKLIDENKAFWGWGSIVFAFLVGLVTLAKVVMLWRKKEVERVPHDLEGCLELLHDLLLIGEEKPSEAALRLTIHVPSDDGKDLVQVLDYVGNGRAKKTAGRLFPMSCGIIGKAYRSRQKFLTAKRKSRDPQAYRKELVEEWGYTEEQAKKLDIDSMAWMAVTLANNQEPDRIEGIVYLDACDPEFFTNVRQTLTVAACAAIARYVTKKYKHEKGPRQ